MQQEKATTLNELYDYLKRFSLSDSLFVVGVVNNVFKYGFNKLHAEDAPPGTLRWINDNFKDVVGYVDLTIQLTRLSRFLLLSGANDYRSVILDTGTDEMRHAMFLTSTLFDKDVEGEIKSMEDITRIFGRMAQWQFPLQDDRLQVIGRAQLLFVDIPAKIGASYDFNGKLKEYFDIDVFQFIASGLALWILSNGVLKHKITIEVDSLKNIITTNSIQKFVELSSGTPEDYRRLVRGEDWQTPNKLRDIYGLEPFVRMPAIKVVRSGKLEPGAYVVPQPFYLLQRASLGIFYLLGDKEREHALVTGTVGRNYFRDSFGAVYREYVGSQLRQGKALSEFVDVDEEIDGEFKKPDFVILKDDGCVLFEVKTALLTVNPRTLFDREATRAEVQQGSFKKALDQLTSFEEAIRKGLVKDGRFKKVTKIVKVIVGFEDIFLANAFMLPLAKEIYGSQVDNLQIATLHDIEIIGNKLANGGNVVQPIIEKTSDHGKAEWSLGQFIAQKNQEAIGKNPLLQSAFERFIKRVAGKDFHQIKSGK